MEILLHDILIMKKPHPCGSTRWEVLRTGADIKMRCTGCGHEVLLPRHKITPRVKSIDRPSTP